jgi:hypothetical protein
VVDARAILRGSGADGHDDIDLSKGKCVYRFSDAFWITSRRRAPWESRPRDFFDAIVASLLLSSASLFLLFDAVGGVLRWGLSLVGLVMLTYLPSALGLLGLLGSLVVRLGDARSALVTFAFTLFVIVECLIALLLGRQFSAVLFGMYIWIPVIVMMALCQRGLQDRVVELLPAVFLIAVAGVLMNIVIAFPWTSATYEVLGLTREAGREWSAQGQQRLGGFSRASFIAAAQIVLGYCVLESRFRSIIWRALFWAAGMVAIYYTTSKSPIIAMGLLPLTIVLVGRIRRYGGARRRRLGGMVLALWMLLIFAGPFLALTYGSSLYPRGVGTGAHYSSLADRILNTWPDAIGMMDWGDPTAWLVGRGIGGIGAPTGTFEPPGNPADNLAIYLFVSFGLGAFLIGGLILRGGLRAIAGGIRGRRDFLLIVVMLGIASAANGVEGFTTALIIGLAIGRPRPQHQ